MPELGELAVGVEGVIHLVGQGGAVAKEEEEEEEVIVYKAYKLY